MLVWSLIVVASVLLVVSITANWVQRAVLDTDEVVNTSDEILADQDVQEALSIFLVDQLYANVDVPAEIREKLPDNAKALAAPVAAATRQLALNVSEKALAAPRVQELVSLSIRRSHGQFVRLIEDEGKYVSTTGGAVTLEYGDVIADLAVRLGVDPEAIARIRDVVRDLSTDLKQRLTSLQTRIKTVRSGLADVQGGTLPPELEQNLEALESNTGQLQGKIASLHTKLETVQEKAPAQLQDRLTSSTAGSPTSTAASQRSAGGPPPCSTSPNRQTSISSTPRSPRPKRASTRSSSAKRSRTPASSSSWNPTSSTDSRRSSRRSATSASCSHCWCSSSTWPPSTWRRDGAAKR